MGTSKSTTLAAPELSADTEQIRRLAAGTLMPGFSGIAVPVWILDAYDAGLAAVCLYGTNVASPVQLRDLCAGLRAHSPSTLIAVDEEGGDVTRLHYLTGSPQPGNAVLGRLDDVTLTATSAATIGQELASLGINLNLAPDADVNSEADNPVIGVRSFGAEPDLVARHTAAWIRGLEDSGVASCAKHFPGHGSTTTDSHLELPRVSANAATLEARELVPFRALVEARGATVMTSHILVDALDPENPATFSSRILQGLLREELGFEGVILTDALDMAGASAQTGVPEAAVRALLAGTDLLCLGSDTGPELYEQTLAAITAAVAEGRLTPPGWPTPRAASPRCPHASPPPGRPKSTRPHPAGSPASPAARPWIPRSLILPCSTPAASGRPSRSPPPPKTGSPVRKPWPSCRWTPARTSPSGRCRGVPPRRRTPSSEKARFRTARRSPSSAAGSTPTTRSGPFSPACARKATP